MRLQRLQARILVVLAIFASTITLAATQAAAQQETVLYSSTGPNPQAAVVFDTGGALYWTANTTVETLRPVGGGTYDESTIYTFANNADPEGTVTFDRPGLLYGTALGTSTDAGSVFQLTPGSGGAWTEQTLYSFPPTAKHGSQPYEGVIFDNAGNLYGTTYYGGAYGSEFNGGGTVFELMPQAGGGWTQKVLHSFGNGIDGVGPRTGLIFDSAGNLYGATTAGGLYSGGTVFKLTPQANGTWKEQILHHFGHGADGGLPYHAIAMDGAGNIYGTTVGGGVNLQGTAFELIPQANGTWKENLLHSFSGGTDGAGPYSGATLDAAGHVYGTTFFGGANTAGIVFELIQHGSLTWVEKVVHTFGTPGDGANPLAGVTFDASGNIFGTTQAGGANGEGTVYEITP